MKKKELLILEKSRTSSRRSCLVRPAVQISNRFIENLKLLAEILVA